MLNSLEDAQKQICEKYSADYKVCDLNLKVSISANIKDGARPINGLRLKEENGTSGWYLWAGDWSDDIDFFKPLHGRHLETWAPEVLKFLGLPEGWRLLLDEDYEDVWFDENLV